MSRQVLPKILHMEIEVYRYTVELLSILCVQEVVTHLIYKGTRVYKMGNY